MLVGIRGLRIRRLPRRGETVRYEIGLLKRLGPLSLVDARALVGDEMIAEGTMKFHVEVAP